MQQRFWYGGVSSTASLAWGSKQPTTQILSQNNEQLLQCVPSLAWWSEQHRPPPATWERAAAAIPRHGMGERSEAAVMLSDMHGGMSSA